MGLRNQHISVLGAGIGGLAAAVALRQLGAKVTVFERAAAVSGVGGGLQIGPNGMKVLRALGVEAALEPQLSKPEAVELRDYRRGGLVARVPMGQAALARYGAPYCQVHRSDLVDALLHRAQTLGVGLRFGCEAEIVRQEGTLTFTNGAQIEAGLVVAADGVRSLARKQLLRGSAPKFTGQVAWRCVVDASALPDDFLPGTTTAFLGPGRHFVTYPLRGGRLRNIVAVEERADWTEEGWSIPSDPEALRAAFARWCEPVHLLTQAVEEVFLWGLFSHPELDRWQTGKVVLLGDACHPMLPFLAQGAGMALEDAWVLADCLDGPEQQGAALAKYEMLRKPRATRVQRASARNAGIYHFGVPALRQGLHLGMRAMSALAPKRMLGRFDWLYGEDVTK